MNGETELKILEKLITLDKGVEGICRRLDVSNGRIAKLEDKCDDVDGEMILLKERDSVDSKERERDLKWHDFFFQWFWRVLMAVIGAGVLIVLQKANILNVSVVNAADYQKIEAITKK